MRKTNQSGTTMIETMGVFAIISVLTIGIIALITKIFDRYQQASIITEIRDMQKNIRARYATFADYSSLSATDAVAKLIQDRVVPAGMVSGGSLYHSYNGPVTVSGTKYEYTITFSNIKKNGCVDLLIQNWTVNDTSDLIKIKANDVEYTWTSSGTTQLPIDLIEAGTRCDNDRTKNKIEWTFQ